MKPAAAIAVAAMALGASVLVWRPWEVAAQQGSGTRGTQQAGMLAERDTITSDEKNQSIPVHITIDSLVRQGDEVTLFWTLRNDSPSGAEVRLESVLDGGFQSDTKKISLSYAGATEPVHPAMRQDKCVCTHWGYGDTIPAGRSRRFHAIFDRLPGKVEKVDVDLVLLGRVKDIPVTES